MIYYRSALKYLYKELSINEYSNTLKTRNLDPTILFKLRDVYKDNLRVGAMIQIFYCGVRPNELINIRVYIARVMS